MADNSTQGGTDTIATDDVTTLNGGASSGIKVQRVKVTYGDDATARDASLAFPLPVTLSVGTTYALTSVNTSGTTNTNTVLLAADATRKALIVWNRGTTDLFLGFGVTTTTTLYSVKVSSGQGYEVPPQFAPAAVNGMTSATIQPVHFSTVT